MIENGQDWHPDSFSNKTGYNEGALKVMDKKTRYMQVLKKLREEYDLPLYPLAQLLS